MRYLLLCLGLIAANSGWSQGEKDHLQRFPEGVSESEYYYREASGENFSEPRIEPPNWWVGMTEPELELLIYDEGIRDLEADIEPYPGVVLVGVEHLANPNYLFVRLRIDETTKPGTLKLKLNDKEGNTVKSYDYELQPRNQTAVSDGISSNDLIYLIMPDRFANGDRSNDDVKGMRQRGIDREQLLFRHGGDLIGIMEHLDYLEDLGTTALWLNPILENDQPYESYHGYAITDHYRVDARLGTNEQYRRLVELARLRNQKLIMDVVFNHVGDEHWFIRDLPAEDWIHQSRDGKPNIAYRAAVLHDPYAAQADKKEVNEGWFDTHMPDLNLRHPQLANFLIQNCIWWTEYSGHDGFRIDTYAYCDQDFMAEWNRRLLNEYPRLGIFAETWVHHIGIQSWFPEGQRAGEHNSYLPGVTDYQMYYAMQEALQQPQSWLGGVARIYYTLTQDYLYKEPLNNVLFLDNHDLGRISGMLGSDLERYKSAISLLLTQRGTPLLYYGTELMMTGEGGAFGEGGRRDFPGGWRRDRDNKFRAKDRTEQEQAAFNHVRRLANYRQLQPALRTGAMTQFVPQDGVYVYFRYNENATVMVAYNSNTEAVSIRTDRYAEQIGDATRARVVTEENTQLEDISELQIPAGGTLVLELN